MINLSRWIWPYFIVLIAGQAKAQDLQWFPIEPLPELPSEEGNMHSKSANETDNLIKTTLIWELAHPLPELPVVSNSAISQEPNGLNWERVQPSDPLPDASDSIHITDLSPHSEPVWTLVPQEDLIAEDAMPQPDTNNKDSARAIQLAYRTREEEAPTYGSSRGLLRDERWHPNISYLIPNGYGPHGFIVDGVITGTDCTLGKGPCEPFTTFANWQDSLNKTANGSTYFNLGFGDTQKWGGIFITNSAETISGAIGSGKGKLIDGNKPLQGVQTGLHYSKAIGPDTSFRTGIENLITWDSKDFTFSDMTRNFYFVGSQRFRLKKPENTSKWFRNFYLTAGIGNGEFKPIEQTFQDQTRALKDAGCQTFGFKPKNPCSNERFKRALRTGSDYGQINPIAAASLEVVDGLNLIGEWSGRNLNAGLSWRPFYDLGLFITPMVESIVRNCEYPGCKVTPIEGFPEKVALPNVVLTDRVRLSLQVSFQVKL